MAVHVTRAGVALTVGIILVTGLIVGGLLWVKNSGEQARRNDAIKVAEQNLQKNSDQGVALNKGDEKSGDTSSGQQSGNGSQSGNQSGQATTNQSAGSNQQSQQQGGSNSGQSSTTELPQTGPSDNLMTFIVIALVTFAGVSYWRSRRSLLQA